MTTPRTDKAEQAAGSLWVKRKLDCQRVVASDFARQLEKELMEAISEHNKVELERCKLNKIVDLTREYFTAIEVIFIEKDNVTVDDYFNQIMARDSLKEALQNYDSHSR